MTTKKTSKCLACYGIQKGVIALCHGSLHDKKCEHYYQPEPQERVECHCGKGVDCPLYPQGVVAQPQECEGCLDTDNCEMAKTAQPSEEWEGEFEATNFEAGFMKPASDGIDMQKVKAFISKVEREAYERGRKMKGSSWREDYEARLRENNGK